MSSYILQTGLFIPLPYYIRINYGARMHVERKILRDYETT